MPHLTPPGRIVWGNPQKAFPKTNQQTRQPVLKDGKQVMQYSFGLAIPKNEFQPTWQAIAAEAMKLYPNGVFPADFAWKFKDGDSADRQGKPYSAREGYGGNYVLSISTEFPIPIYQFNNGAYVQVGENGIKTGDYARVELNITAHSGQSPGVYINPTMVQLLGYGQAIISAGNPMEAFGAAPPPLPPGASPTPVSGAPAGVMPPGYGGAPGNPTMPGMPPAAGFPANGAVPPMMNPAAPQPTAPGGFPSPTAYPSNPGYQPNPQFVQNATGAPPPAMPGMTAPAAGAPAMPGQPRITGYNPVNGQPIYG